MKTEVSEGNKDTDQALMAALELAEAVHDVHVTGGGRGSAHEHTEALARHDRAYRAYVSRRS